MSSISTSCQGRGPAGYRELHSALCHSGETVSGQVGSYFSTELSIVDSKTVSTILNRSLNTESRRKIRMLVINDGQFSYQRHLKARANSRGLL